MGIRISAIVWNSHADMLARAARGLDWLDLDLISSKSLERGDCEPAEALERLGRGDMIFLYRSSESFWDEMEPGIRELGRGKPVACIGFDPSYWSMSTLPPEVLQTAYNYVAYGGMDNFSNLLAYLACEAVGAETSPQPPREVPWQGLYHPDAPVESFAGAEAYLEWYEGHARELGLADGPVAGLLVGRHYWVNQATEGEDLLIRELEALGMRTMPVFSNNATDAALGNKGALETCEEVFLDHEGGSRVDVLLKLQSFFLGRRQGDDEADTSRAMDGAQFYHNLGVPVLQPVFSSTKTVAEWEADPQGLGAEIAWSVAMPEFEGVIEPFYLGGVVRGSDASSGADLETRAPVAERCRRLARRTLAWAELSRRPVSKRRAAFILHNDPCAAAEATVGGAAKLDSLESLARILQAMDRAGYDVAPPESGEALIKEIMDRKAISEFRWTTIEEIVAKGGALDFIGLDRYLKWWNAYPEAVRERVAGAWGNPPGELTNGIPPAMVHDGKIVVTGVAYGNAVVAVQPKRGCAGSRCDGVVCKILHDPDVPPPHQYLATYRWLQDKEDGFGADVLIHVGTHGNLEFLPGKNVGLSRSCLPDLVLHEVPHLYIYNSDNPPEGTIAKRRTYAALVDHMQTAMTASGLYGDLAELDDLLGQWERARHSDAGRAHQLEHMIQEALDTTGVRKQIKNSDGDFAALARDAHEALSAVQNTRIQDGMHVFGQAPEGERLADFIYTIVRFDEGEPDSLRAILARAMGLDLDALLADPGAVDPESGRSFGDVLEDLEGHGTAAVSLALSGLDGDGFARAVARSLGLSHDGSGSLDGLEKVRLRILDIRERVAASKEIEALLNGMKGGFVEPGPSGIISRGREDILPTGRNFYTLDPRTLPTKAAWRVGQMLAQAVIDKHMDEEGRIPENVAMFWMCNDLMWSDGEGMAQIFHLLGVRPVWKSNGWVDRVEAVPLEELGRPRIDVTVRVSGLTRDNFPGCMELVDEAVQLAASLDEPEDDNFVRKHALSAMREQGAASGDADNWRRATMRVFSARPGTYRAGVNLAVYASAWKDRRDLTDIYLYWNAFAYGKGLYGEQAGPELERALKTVDVTFNKVVTDEHDLFGCCAYFGTHGGLTAAARELSGREVKSYYGDTRETRAVKVRDLADEIRRVVRTKLLNPKWIEGMKRHGYKGAGDISKRVGRVYGWEASTEEVDDWIFDDIARTFVLDEENREFFRENNPWALEEIGRRLLEANGRGLWEAEPEVLEGLQEHYLEMEGWIEEDMGDAVGEFQGGSVDVYTPGDVETWNQMLKDFNAGKPGSGEE